MVLQELIRAIALYRGILEPFISSWKYWINDYRTQNSNFFRTKLISGSLRWIQERSGGAFFLNELSLASTMPFFESNGTCTITHKIKVRESSLSQIATNSILFSASFSGNSIFLPGHTSLHKEIVLTSKTITIIKETGTNLTGNASFLRQVSATGFISENNYSFLFHETHDKREFLGEFSLIHDENHYCISERR